MTKLEIPNSELPTPSLQDPCYVNAMSHFYRGELGRIMIWRQRLDVTTTWAITTTTTIIGVAFSFKDVPHIIFFFNLALVWFMLWIESRRYRFYDAFRGRVMAVTSMVASLASISGFAVAGPLVDSIGVRQAFTLAGALICVASIPVLSLVWSAARAAQAERTGEA